MIYTDFSKIPLFGYNMIMADPPWEFKLRSDKGEDKSPQAQYNCMPLDEICSMNVADLAAGNCLLWLWVTNPMIDQGLDVLRAWGFQFKTAGTWVKMSKSWTADGWKDGKEPKLNFGTGYILRSANEPFLIGTMGDNDTSKSVRSAIRGAVREHSRKPDEAYREAERLLPSAYRLDMFSREERQGWDSFGFEAGKFNEKMQ